jgi:sulfoxide reductase heme-binding subunit YedZ
MMARRFAAPWRDHAGRLSMLKIVTLLVAIAPGALLAFRWWTHDLGGRPITELIHGAGDWTVRFLLASLAVTPLRHVLNWPRVLLLRRMLGVTAAVYAASHFLLYCVDENWRMFTVVSEIVLRFYLTIGFVALLGLLTLAVTSTDGWQKRLGRRWKKLHRIVFPITILAVLHYALQSKSDVTAAVIAAGVFVWLALWRYEPRRWQAKLWPLPLLAIAAGLITAGIETAWYGLATGANAERVLLANLDIRFGLRPALQIILAALLLALLAAARRVRWGRRKQVGRALPSVAIPHEEAVERNLWPPPPGPTRG